MESRLYCYYEGGEYRFLVNSHFSLDSSQLLLTCNRITRISLLLGAFVCPLAPIATCLRAEIYIPLVVKYLISVVVLPDKFTKLT